MSLKFVVVVFRATQKQSTTYLEAFARSIWLWLSEVMEEDLTSLFPAAIIRWACSLSCKKMCQEVFCTAILSAFWVI